MWEYTEKVKDFFLKPKNIGEVENPDAVGDVGSILAAQGAKQKTGHRRVQSK